METIRSLKLASKSPRRSQILTQMGVSFEVVSKEVDESFPASLTPEQAVVFIAEKKAKAFLGEKGLDLLMTADTVVCLNGEIIGKPPSREEAFETLNKLSGKVHEVISAVTFLECEEYSSYFEKTEVHFRELTFQEIKYYIDTYKPFDKAGAYGIQEWIGQVAIEKINGSYTNVMGLPSGLVYRELLARGAVKIS